MRLRFCAEYEMSGDIDKQSIDKLAPICYPSGRSVTILNLNLRGGDPRARLNILYPPRDLQGSHT